MTKRLEELLNLAPAPDTTPEETAAIIDENRDLITEVDSAISKIDAALSLIHI